MNTLTDRLERLARVLLLVFLMFGAVSAISGGAALIALDGFGMPVSMLEGSPFTSFVVPGLVLLVVVGGSQAVGFVAALRRWPTAPLWSAVAGFGMIIWIVVEVVIIQAFTALHAIYFSVGIAQLALVIGASWLATPRARTTANYRLV